MGIRRSTRTAYWCIGNLILAITALVITLGAGAQDGIGIRISFLSILFSSFLCIYALKLELGQKINLPLGAACLCLLYACFETIYRYGSVELRVVFSQFVYAGFLLFLCLYAFRIYKEQRITNAKWLAYSYIPAFWGLLKVPYATLFIYATLLEPIPAMESDVQFPFSLLLSAVLSQFAYLALILEKSSRNEVTDLLLTENSDQGRIKINSFAHANRQKILLELTPYLAHEISQPVSSIVLEAQYIEALLHKTPQENKEILFAARKISNSAKAASEILNNIRSFIKPSAAAQTIINLVELARNAHDLTSSLARNCGVQFLFSSTQEAIFTSGDSALLTRA